MHICYQEECHKCATTYKTFSVQEKGAVTKPRSMRGDVAALFLLKIAQGIEPRAHFRSNYTSPSRTPFAILLKGAEGEPFRRGSIERKRGHNLNLLTNHWPEVLLQPLLSFLRMGRNTGVEPVHVRFTAECVHRFTNCATARLIYAHATDNAREIHHLWPRLTLVSPFLLWPRARWAVPFVLLIRKPRLGLGFDKPRSLRRWGDKSSV